MWSMAIGSKITIFDINICIYFVVIFIYLFICQTDRKYYFQTGKICISGIYHFLVFRHYQKEPGIIVTQNDGLGIRISPCAVASIFVLAKDLLFFVDKAKDLKSSERETIFVVEDDVLS